MIIESRAHIGLRSEFDLIQERYPDEPWKIMIVCLMLNMTKGRQVKAIIDRFFERYPGPVECAGADRAELLEIIKSLGLGEKRVSTLIRFSQEWCEQPWNDISDLHGIGQYARDAWSVFVEGRLPDPESVNDGKLKPYVEWARSLA